MKGRQLTPNTLPVSAAPCARRRTEERDRLAAVPNGLAKEADLI
jgi:hypothetical protein